jgi:hypothetical protein
MRIKRAILLLPQLEATGETLLGDGFYPPLEATGDLEA